jgi:4-alpha-glucanotransferase
MKMLFPRSSGILLHPTSLPGRYGIGDLGEYAYRFIDYLRAAGQSVWQVLPLGPTSYGDSPYQTLSAFAGNPNLVSLDKLVQNGWLTAQELADVPDFPVYEVDYGPVIEYHNLMLRRAYERFQTQANPRYQSAFDEWCTENAYWLDDYTLFAALKEENDGKAWVEWADQDAALYRPDAMKAARQRLSDRINEYRFRQWLFFTQWEELKRYANARGIRIIGDIPIFVAHDSADVWAKRENYYLDERGNPTVVAGVPPDYFSATGQRWGNPLYRWDVLKAHNYDWWIDRFRATLSLVDLVRIDHFRGFEDYWEIPATEPTAVRGQWVKGPNVHFFKVLRERLGELPIIAEDLGDITEAVLELRRSLGLPGMKVLHFAWSDPDNPFLPHNYETENYVVYTGTHDNNSTLGWWMDEASPGNKRYLQSYVDREVTTEPHWTLIRTGMMSCGHTFVAPMQDILGFGADTRMNTPGIEQGNWRWRFSEEWLDRVDLRDRLAHLTRVYGRWPGEKQTGLDPARRQETN